MTDPKFSDPASHESDDLSTAAARSPEDRSVLDSLVAQKYKLLKQLAKKIRLTDPAASLTATALLNEAYLKLSKKPGDLGGKPHAQVLAIMASAMWEILIDQARSRRAAKRGAGIRPISLDAGVDVLKSTEAFSPEDVLELRIARQEMEVRNPRMAAILDCRFCLGMTSDETALALGLSKSTVERDGREAKSYLKTRLRPANLEDR